VDIPGHAVRLTRAGRRRDKLIAVKLELTHRGAYAIRAVLTLAREDGTDVVPARRIAKRMEIPVRFLPQVLGDLSRAGIVEARLGRAGGYRLAKTPASISVLDIIEAAEGDTRRQTCVLTGRPCGESSVPCDVHAVFSVAQVAILARLSETTVADVLAASASEEITAAIEGIASGGAAPVAAAP
jgi:Rrf2 family protein